MKTALITGATSGFGMACAELLAGKYKLVITGRRLDRLEKLKKELSGKSQVHIMNFDIRDTNQMKKTWNEIPEEFSEISVLINNAGLALGVEKAFDAKIENWRQMIETNISGLSEITHLCLPTMLKNNDGFIINIGSIAGSWPYPGGNVYGATKAFVAQFSRNLRADLIGKNIRVCNIEPGLAETEFSIVRLAGDKNKADKIYQKIKPLLAEDIAKNVEWVLSQPAHVNINSLEIMPSCQAWGALAVSRPN